jgi:hypothetical protein
MLLKGLLLESCEFLEDYSHEKFQSLDEFKEKKITPNHYFELKEIHNFLSQAGVMNDMELVKEKLIKDMTIEQNIILNYLISEKPDWLRSFSTGYEPLKLKLIDDNKDNELECLELCGLSNRGNQQSEKDKTFFFKLKKIAEDLSKKTSEDDLREIGLRGEEASYNLEIKKNSVVEIYQGYLESDSLGYDLKVTFSDNKKKYIEVKASQKPLKYAEAYLTSNEISTALDIYKIGKHKHCFHFWDFSGSENFLAEIPFEEIKDHLYGVNEKIIGNRLEKQILKYDLFKDKFKKANIL